MYHIKLSRLYDLTQNLHAAVAWAKVENITVYTSFIRSSGDLWMHYKHTVISLRNMYKSSIIIITCYLHNYDLRRQPSSCCNHLYQGSFQSLINILSYVPYTTCLCFNEYLNVLVILAWRVGCPEFSRLS